jgi:hypothetical protein
VEKYISNSGLEFVILNQSGKQCIIQFTETGYTRTANIDNIRVGKVRDFYNKSVYGVGFYGEFEKVYYWKQAKQLWQNMLKRCYCEKDLRGYSKWGTTVDERWQCFANFLADLPSLENFDKWLKGQKEGRDKFNLDKDFKFPGNNVYSREACCFLEDSLNKSLGAKSKLDSYYRTLSK